MSDQPEQEVETVWRGDAAEDEETRTVVKGDDLEDDGRECEPDD